MYRGWGRMETRNALRVGIVCHQYIEVSTTHEKALAVAQYVC